jgi:hypothetical protein
MRLDGNDGMMATDTRLSVVSAQPGFARRSHTASNASTVKEGVRGGTMGSHAANRAEARPTTAPAP